MTTMTNPIPIKPIKSEADYDAALEQIAVLMDAEGLGLLKPMPWMSCPHWLRIMKISTIRLACLTRSQPFASVWNNRS